MADAHRKDHRMQAGILRNLKEGPAPEVPPSRHEASEYARDVRCRGSYLPSLSLEGINPFSLCSRPFATLRLFLPFFHHLLVAANCASRRGRSLGKLLWSRNRVSGAHDPYSVLHLSSLGSPLVPTQWKKECCCWCCPSAQPPALGKKGDAGSIGWHNPVSRGRVGRGLCVFYYAVSGGPGSAQGPRGWMAGWPILGFSSLSHHRWILEENGDTLGLCGLVRALRMDRLQSDTSF